MYCSFWNECKQTQALCSFWSPKLKTGYHYETRFHEWGQAIFCVRNVIFMVSFIFSFLLFMNANLHKYVYIPQEGNSETIQISDLETRAYTLLVNKVIVQGVPRNMTVCKMT